MDFWYVKFCESIFNNKAYSEIMAKIFPIHIGGLKDRVQNNK